MLVGQEPSPDFEWGDVDGEERFFGRSWGFWTALIFWDQISHMKGDGWRHQVQVEVVQ